MSELWYVIVDENGKIIHQEPSKFYLLCERMFDKCLKFLVSFFS